jgi:hypothetical protein
MSARLPLFGDPKFPYKVGDRVQETIQGERTGVVERIYYKFADDVWYLKTKWDDGSPGFYYCGYQPKFYLKKI